MDSRAQSSLGSAPAAPSLRLTLAVAGFALAVRLAVLGVTLSLAPVGIENVAELHDGREYLQVAAALGSAEADAALPRPAQRLSPGYPLLIRAASWLLPAPLAAVLLAMLGAAVASALMLRLGASAWAAALFAVLTPSWVVFSATAMSEGPFLALALFALLAWRRGWSVCAGLAFGAATLVRPVGVVIFAALWFADLWLADAGSPGAGLRVWRHGLTRHGVGSALAFAVPPALWAAWAAVVQGGPSSLGTYASRDGAWPLTSLLAGLADPLADPGKALQNLFVLTLIAAAAWLLWRRLHRREAAGEAHHDRQWFFWLLSQAAFYVLLPSHWVFQSLPRFLVTALPAVAVAADGVPWLGRGGGGTHGLRRAAILRALVLAFFTAASMAISVYWTLRAVGALR